MTREGTTERPPSSWAGEDQVASYFTGFGGGSWGRWPCSLSGRRNRTRPVRDSGQLPPRALPSPGGGVHLQQVSSSILHRRGQKHQLFRSFASRWSRWEGHRGGGCEVPGTCASYLAACLRFQNSLPHPAPGKAQTPSVRGSGCDSVWSDQCQLGETPTLEWGWRRGRQDPLLLLLSPTGGRRQGGAEEVLLAKPQEGRLALTALNKESQSNHKKLMFLPSPHSGDLLQSKGHNIRPLHRAPLPPTSPPGGGGERE